MSHSPCGHIEAKIQQITQELQSIDDQLHALEVKGLSQMDPYAYAVLQRQMDSLVVKKCTLQDAWDRAMTDLAICRAQPSTSHQKR